MVRKWHLIEEEWASVHDNTKHDADFIKTGKKLQREPSQYDTYL